MSYETTKGWGGAVPSPVVTLLVIALPVIVAMAIVVVIFVFVFVFVVAIVVAMLSLVAVVMVVVVVVWMRKAPTNQTMSCDMWRKSFAVAGGSRCLNIIYTASSK